MASEEEAIQMETKSESEKSEAKSEPAESSPADGAIAATTLIEAEKVTGKDGMFEAAVCKFVKTVGRESLVAVPNMDEANRCRPFSVVVKRNRRWFWQSPKMEVTPFKLYELLTNPDAMSPGVNVDSRKLTNYNKTYSYSLDGKIGAQLKLLLDVELEGVDSVKVEARFGDICKEEVAILALMQLLLTKKLDEKNEFVTQVREDSRKVLCVITGIAKTTTDASVHVKKSVSGEEKVEVEGIAKKIADPEEDAKVSDDSDKTLEVPADTPLAYNYCELLIHGDGSLELMVEKGTKGGFEESEGKDELDTKKRVEDLADDDTSPLTTLKSEQRTRLTEAITGLCCYPTDLDIVYEALKDAAGKNSACLVRGVKQWPFIPPVLETAGGVQDKLGSDGPETQLRYVFPEEKSELFRSVMVVMSALRELDDDEVLAIANCDENSSDWASAISQATKEKGPGVVATWKRAIVELCKTMHSFPSSPVKLTDAIAPVYDDPNPFQMFAESLGVKLEKNQLTAEEDNPRELEAAYRVVTALWYELGGGNTKSSKKNPCVLV